MTSDERRCVRAMTVEITDVCRETHGTSGAFEIATGRIEEEYDSLTLAWPPGKTVKFRLVLEIDYPTAAKATSQKD